MILRTNETSSLVRTLAPSRARVWSGLSLVAVLMLATASPASSPRLRGKVVRLRPLALNPGALLLPGMLALDEGVIPVDGTKYELKLHHLHTGESLDVVYRIGDMYLPAAMAELNHFLRDHRTDDESHYDPKEFDLLHNVLARLGKSSGTIDIVCGYRTPWSNAFLRGQSADTGVAEHSQHILGKAIDIRVPGVTTSRLRDAALSLAAGGVGYYPVSQFVHVDVGPVRQWSFGGGAAHARHKRGVKA